MAVMKSNRFFLYAGCIALFAVAGCGQSDGLGDLAAGKAAFEAKDLKKADRLLESSLQAVGTNVEALVTASRVKLGLGDMAGAVRLIDRAATIAGGDTDVRLLSAQIAWHARDYGKAQKFFAGLAEDSSLSPELRSEGFAGAGIVAMTDNRRDAARIAFLQAIRADRRNAAAWYHLGLLYRDSFGYPEAALEQFNIFVRLDGEASPRVQRVMRTYVPELKEAIARAAADRPGASKRDSAASAAALLKAEEAWKKGNFKTAKESYQAAVAADPLSYPAALGLAKAWLKTDATRKGLSNALEAYKLACMLRPTAISTFVDTANLATRLGHNALAVDVYSRVLASDPSSLTALDGLIGALQRVGGKAEVARAYQRYRDTLATAKKSKRK